MFNSAYRPYLYLDSGIPPIVQKTIGRPCSGSGGCGRAETTPGMDVPHPPYGVWLKKGAWYLYK